MNSDLENRGGMVILCCNSGSLPSAVGYPRSMELRGGDAGFGRGDYEIRERRHEMTSRLPIALFTVLGALGTGQSAAAPVTPPNVELPAIDAAAPAATETATFALG
jgi:hypothetical protein